MANVEFRAHSNKKTIFSVFFAAFLVILMVFGISTIAKSQESLEPVDVALILLVDVSGSVDAAEYDIQKRGISNALRDPSVQQAFLNGPNGKIALSIIEFTGIAMPIVKWKIITTKNDMITVANMYDAAVRLESGSTSITAGLEKSGEYFSECECEPLKRVIDISGDGTNNAGDHPRLIRDILVDHGIVINGLIIEDETGLEQYYINSVIGGTGHFLKKIKDFNDFPETMKRKLILEIS